MDRLSRFFGGSPAAVLLRLVFLSIVVGVILAAMGLDAYDLVRSLERLFRRVFNNAWDALDAVVRWFLLGAVIVIPLWLISRLFAGTRR